MDYWNIKNKEYQKNIKFYNNRIFENIFSSLSSFGISKLTATSIAKYSSIINFYNSNVHIAYTRIGDREIWCMNQKKTDILYHRKSSEHAEEGLIKKINKSYYRKQIKNPIKIYSIRINRFGDIKCAKPCKDCMKCIISSKIKVKNIIWIEYNQNGFVNIISQNISKSNLKNYGFSSGRRWNKKKK